MNRNIHLLFRGLHRVVATAALTACTAVFSSAQALTVVPMSFKELCDKAELIVKARVVAAEAFAAGDIREPQAEQANTISPRAAATDEPADSPAPSSLARPEAANGAGGGRPGGHIRTQVSLEILDTIKGRTISNLELETLGGKLGDLRMFIPGLPELRTGETYLLFVQPAALRGGMPLVGAFQGYFRYVTDSTSGVQSLVDAADRPVLGLTASGLSLGSSSRAHASSGSESDDLLSLNSGSPLAVAEGEAVKAAKPPASKKSSTPMAPEALIEGIHKILGSSR